MKKEIYLILACVIPFSISSSSYAEPTNILRPDDHIKSAISDSNNNSDPNFSIGLPMHIDTIMKHGNAEVLQEIIEKQDNKEIRKIAERAYSRLSNGLSYNVEGSLNKIMPRPQSGIFGIWELVNWGFDAGDLLRAGHLHEWASYTQQLQSGPIKALQSLTKSQEQHFWQIVPVELTVSADEIHDTALEGSGESYIKYKKLKSDSDRKYLPIEIDGDEYDAVVDTGLFFSSVPRSDLRNISYKKIGQTYSSDLFGNRSIVDVVLLKSVKMGKYVFKNVLFTVDDRSGEIFIGNTATRNLNSIFLKRDGVILNYINKAKCTQRLYVSSDLSGTSSFPVVLANVDNSSLVPLLLDTGNHVTYPSSSMMNLTAVPLTFIEPFRGQQKATSLVYSIKGKTFINNEERGYKDLRVFGEARRKVMTMSIKSDKAFYAAFLNDTFLWNNSIYIEFNGKKICSYEN